MNTFNQVSQWIQEDDFRVSCLRQVHEVMKHEWYIAAGFVRNLVWDKLHENERITSLNDIDVIYFNPVDISPDIDEEIEHHLVNEMPFCNWSVKNQARMSLNHGHAAYKGCIEAMSYWPEIQTAIGATITPKGMVNIESPFKAKEVIKLSITRNHKCTSSVFSSRVSEKGWLNTWPKLKIET